MPVDGKLDLF